MTIGQVGGESSASEARESRTAGRRWPGRVVGWGAVLAGLGGWWVSLDLLRISGGVRPTNPWLAAQCGEEAGDGGCLSVLRSERARVGGRSDATGSGQAGGGIPWAALGMAYFAFVATWYALVGVPDVGRRAWHAIIAVVVGLGAAFSIDLIRVMALELRAWCAGCLLAHAMNGVIAALTIAAYFAGRRGATAPQPTGRHAAAALAAGLLAIVVHVNGVQLAMATQTLNRLRQELGAVMADAEYARLRHARQPLVEIPLREEEGWLGSAGARHTAVMFGDFQCPACRQAFDLLRTLVAERPGELRVALRHFPQDSACNRHYGTRAHPAACAAARAAEAAREVGGQEAYLRMRALLYERQHDLELGRFDEWAREIGLDAAAFERARNGASAAARVAEDVEIGGALGVRSVPVIYLDGRRVEYWSQRETWTALLSEE